MSGLEALSAIGDLGLLLSLAAALLAWLLSSRPAAGIAFAIAMIACAAATSLLKIYLHACPMIPLLRGPSGHVSFATLIYGVLVAVIASRAPAWARIPLAVAGAALIAAVAVARYFLAAHNVAEIAFGIAVGVVSLTIFTLLGRRGGIGGRPLKPLVLAVVAIAIVGYGYHFDGEQFVNFLAFGGETAQLSVATACPAHYGQRLGETPGRGG